MNNTWQIQEVKSKLSEFVDRTLIQGVQIITRSEHKAVLVIPFAEYEQFTRGSGRLALSHELFTRYLCVVRIFPS